MVILKLQMSLWVLKSVKLETGVQIGCLRF